MSTKPKIIDLFSGCGGLSYGFHEAGYEVLLGVDNWKDAIDTFKYNHKESQGVIADLFFVKPEEIFKITGIKEVDVIVGGPPCQGFSIAGRRKIEDERNGLYKSFVDFVTFYKPKAFLMENVPNIVSMGGGIVNKNIIKDFETIGYKIEYKILTASYFGVPQKRRRAFFIGLKSGKKFEFPIPGKEALITSEEAISDLPEHSLTDGSPYLKKSNNNYQEFIRNGAKGIFNHQITFHKDETIRIISLVPDGGNYKNLPEDLQSTRNVHIAWTRLNSKMPSFTIDTGHRHHFHYKFDRIPTVRESARIQSFPDSFVFLGTKTSQYKQVGNAVPPGLAKVLAEKMFNYL